MSAFNTMVTYTNDVQSHIFLPSLLFTATLHMSIRRSMYYDYNATEPAWANYITNITEFNLETQNCYYPTYYTKFLQWMPQWAKWRKSQLSKSTDSDKEDTWTVKDATTGQVCSATQKDSTYMNGWADGTYEAILNEIIGNMLSVLQPFSGLHRFVPGWEKNNTIYPASDATWPLNLYREGIKLGPYAASSKVYISGVTAQNPFVGGQAFQGGYYQQQDKQGNITAVDVYGYPHTNGWLTSIDFTYDYGKGTGGNGKNQNVSPSTKTGSYVVNDQLEDGWVSWMATTFFNNAPEHAELPIARASFGFGNPAGEIKSTKMTGGATGIFMVNMTLGNNFAMSGLWKQECNCNSYALAGLATWFQPTDLYVGNSTDLPMVNSSFVAPCNYGRVLPPSRNPVNPTASPVDPAAAPVDPTAAPVDPNVAPVDPTAAPVDPTAAPVDPTTGTVDPTAAPVDPTPAPIDPTTAPVDPTAAPVDPTAAPVDPTAAPVDPTAAPIDPTAAPVDPTAAPVHPTAAPVDPTFAPVDPTAVPVDPTAAPVDPTSAPVEPTAAPVEPTAALPPSRNLRGGRH